MELLRLSYEQYKLSSRKFQELFRKNNFNATVSAFYIILNEYFCGFLHHIIGTTSEDLQAADWIAADFYCTDGRGAATLSRTTSFVFIMI